MKKITVLTLIVFIFLIVFTACTNMDPLGIANGIPEGYNPDAVPDAVDNDWIYYAEGSTIKKMRLDGTEISTAFTVNYSQGEIRKLLLDPIKQKIYIFNYFAAITNDIYQYNLDGSEEKHVVTAGTSDIYDMAIDHIHSYLYYSWNGGIKSINLNDSLLEANALTLSIGSPSYLFTDYQGGLYFFDNALVYKVDTVATATSLNVTPAITISSQGPITDTAGKIVYYYESSLFKKIDLDTSVSVNIVDPSASIVGALSLYEKGGRIYFYSDDGAQYKIYSIALDGTDTKKLILDNGSTPIQSFDILAK